MSPLIGSARYRTHTCAGAAAAEGGRARVAGWVHRRRDHGGVVFIDLRDRSGILQLVFHPEGAGAAAHAAAGELSPEDVVSVEGEVVGALAGDRQRGAPHRRRRAAGGDAGHARRGRAAAVLGGGRDARRPPRSCG